MKTITLGHVLVGCTLLALIVWGAGALRHQWKENKQIEEKIKAADTEIDKLIKNATIPASQNFKMETIRSDLPRMPGCYQITDLKTGKRYLVVRDGYGLAVCPLIE